MVDKIATNKYFQQVQIYTIVIWIDFLSIQFFFNFVVFENNLVSGIKIHDHTK